MEKINTEKGQVVVFTDLGVRFHKLLKENNIKSAVKKLDESTDVNIFVSSRKLRKEELTGNWGIDFEIENILYLYSQNYETN